MASTGPKANAVRNDAGSAACRDAHSCNATKARNATLGQTDARGKDYQPQDWQLTGSLGMNYSSGDYGTPVKTDVLLGIPSLSLQTGDFKFSASMPYMQISGRGLSFER